MSLVRRVSFACGNLGKREEYYKDVSMIEADNYRGIPEVWLMNKFER
jgi:hypothetical protein